MYLPSTTRLRRKLRATWWCPFLHVLLLSFALAPLAQAAPAAHRDGAAAPALHLGLQMGLLGGSAAQTFALGQYLGDILGGALNRPVTWVVQTPQQTRTTPQPLMFIRPPDMTADLLAKGWKLVAVARGQAHFGVDLIASPCAGQPGKVQLGGSKTALLGVHTSLVPVCVDPSQVWTSPAAVLLTPQRGSLVERVARKMWHRHTAGAPVLAHAGTQEGVIGLMRDMHVPTVGVVTPTISGQWQAESGVVLVWYQTASPVAAVIAAATLAR